ncbi:hypothetical protein [Desulfovibrio sp. ZJ369]|uniref:hypothetical protein n=1 Tax=Desulfovibrio sp. ZJ369 TaxID=2709793 RepID=UPI0013EDE82D|nr:hypothetical protein [Desulfovibrio sp. ZJ369]
MLQNARKIAEQNYNDVRAVLMPGLEAYKSGDMNTFSDSMVKASQVVNMPYRIEPAGDGNYKLFFRSDAKGGWTDTGRKMTGQEVFEMGRNYLRGEINVLSGMGMKLTPYNQQQVLEGMRRAMATNDTNVENMADYSRHIPLLNANGRIVGMAIPQNPLDGSKNTEYDAYGMNGKPLGRFDVQGILQRGMRFGNMVQKSGRGAGGSGRYSLSSGDISILNKYATRTDPETGEKTTDYGTAAFLEGIVRQTGLTPHAAIAAFEDNVKMAMQKGASREQAEKYVMARMGQPQPNAAAPQAQNGAHGSPAGGAPGGEAKAAPASHGRILKAAHADGKGAQPEKHDPNEGTHLKRAQDAAYHFMQDIGTFMKSAGGSPYEEEDDLNYLP